MSINIQDINNNVNQYMNFLDGPILADLVRLVIIVFATKFVPPFPDSLTTPLNNVYLRIIAVFIIIWTGNKNPVKSFVLAITFVFGINLLSGRGIFEDPEEGYGGLMDKPLDKDEKFAKKRAEHGNESKKPMDVESKKRSHDIMDDFGIPMAVPFDNMNFQRF